MTTRNRSALAGLILLFAAGCGGASIWQSGRKTPIWQDATWEEYRSDEGRYTVQLPGTPRQLNKGVITPCGRVAGDS